MPRQSVGALRLLTASLLTASSIVCLALASTSARAEDGTLRLMPSTEWADPLSEAEMAELRGGFNGLTFGVVFTGGLSPNLEPVGDLQITAQPPAGTKVTQNGNGSVNVQAVVGSLGGASGVFQITQVPGSFNVVNNNLIVQINVVQSIGTVPDLNTLLNLTQ